MKRLLAIIMSAAMIVSCIPAMAFAGTADVPPEPPKEGDEPREGSSPGSVDPNHEDVLRDADGQIRVLTLELKKYVTSQEFIELYDKLSALLDEYRPLVDDFVDELRNEKGPQDDPEGTKDIDYYGKMIDAYIRDLNNILVSYSNILSSGWCLHSFKSISYCLPVTAMKIHHKYCAYSTLLTMQCWLVKDLVKGM